MATEWQENRKEWVENNIEVDYDLYMPQVAYVKADTVEEALDCICAWNELKVSSFVMISGEIELTQGGENIQKTLYKVVALDCLPSFASTGRKYQFKVKVETKGVEPFGVCRLSFFKGDDDREGLLYAIRRAEEIEDKQLAGWLRELVGWRKKMNVWEYPTGVR